MQSFLKYHDLLDQQQQQPQAGTKKAQNSVDSKTLYCRTPETYDLGTILQGIFSGFGRKVRLTAKKSELEAESQRYNRADPQNPNRIAEKRWLNGV